jgi:hypothetical protein
MFRNCNSIFWKVNARIATLIYITTLPCISFALGDNRNDKLDTLKKEYGLSITIPDNWTDSKFGHSITDKNRLFTFLAVPPTENPEDSNEKLEIYVRKTISNLHVFACTGDSLTNAMSSEIEDCSSCTPVDLKTGAPVNKLSIISSMFIGPRWYPPSIEKFNDSNSNQLIG